MQPPDTTQVHPFVLKNNFALFCPLVGCVHQWLALTLLLCGQLNSQRLVVVRSIKIRFPTINTYDSPSQCGVESLTIVNCIFRFWLIHAGSDVRCVWVMFSLEIPFINPPSGYRYNFYHFHHGDTRQHFCNFFPLHTFISRGRGELRNETLAS